MPSRTGEDQADYLDWSVKNYDPNFDKEKYFAMLSVSTTNTAIGQESFALNVKQFFKRLIELEYKKFIIFTNESMWERQIGVHGRDIWEIEGMHLWLSHYADFDSSDDSFSDDSDQDDDSPNSNSKSSIEKSKSDKTSNSKSIESIKLPYGATKVHFWKKDDVCNLSESIEDFNVSYINNCMFEQT